MSVVPVFPKVSQYRCVEAFRARCAELGIEIPCDSDILSQAGGSPLGWPIEVFGRQIGNRWCIHPMEGWDGTSDGEPSDWTGQPESVAAQRANVACHLRVATNCDPGTSRDDGVQR